MGATKCLDIIIFRSVCSPSDHYVNQESNGQLVIDWPFSCGWHAGRRCFQFTSGGRNFNSVGHESLISLANWCLNYFFKYKRSVTNLRGGACWLNYSSCKYIMLQVPPTIDWNGARAVRVLCRFLHSSSHLLNPTTNHDWMAAVVVVVSVRTLCAICRSWYTSSRQLHSITNVFGHNTGCLAVVSLLVLHSVTVSEEEDEEWKSQFSLWIRLMAVCWQLFINTRQSLVFIE